MIITGIVLMVCYALVLLWVVVGFLRLAEFSSEKFIPITTFTVIIPFRNEAEHLPTLIESLKNLNYPKHLFELILVDDESEDSSVKIIQDEISRLVRIDNPLHIQLIKNKRLSASPKKDAITKAIKIAQHEWIVTTDADCTVPAQWLQALDAFIQNHAFEFIAAPVSLQTGNGLLQNFQQFDHCSLQSLTLGSFGNSVPLLCNGANICYKKQLFLSLNGFSGNDHLASGDDIFMLEKALQKDAKKVGFLKSRNAIVATSPQQKWAALINQRVRWASKTSTQKSLLSKAIGLLVFFTNLWFLAACLVVFFQQEMLIPLLLLFIIKMILDGFIILLSAHFFRSKKNLAYYLVSSSIYPFFTVFVLLKSFAGSYYWKGRNYPSAS
ncbi:glycosyltransferase [Jejudonia soesokkakensis]|uniref:Glycosyltransferase n=1 Tax=Jejudonia soesokkakensis TaxID=1323432 RepID=A0ABW2MNN5_9FLAO